MPHAKSDTMSQPTVNGNGNTSSQFLSVGLPRFEHRERGFHIH